MTRQELSRRAKAREQRRRQLKFRRIVFSVLLATILITLVYSCYSYYKIRGLKKEVETLQQQLENSETGQESLEEQLEQLQKQLEEKERQLQLRTEALTDYPEKPNVYLTFDDGPSRNTDAIMDTLAEENVCATFFCIARQGQKNADRYQRIVQEGHTLGMHSYSHDYKVIYQNLNSFKEDVTGISDFLFGITGVVPEFYRFPGGSSNAVSDVSMKKCIRYVKKKGLTYFDWNAQNDDATGKAYTSDQLVEHAMGSVRAAGDNVVLLMHDEETKTATAESLPELIQTLKAEGYDILPITKDTKLVQHMQ